MVGRRFLSFLVFLSALLVLSPSLSGREARLLRFPGTNGREVAFSYGGDLWVASLRGGEARRLTSHVGEETFARYSPDGKFIAFSAQYDGNTEVYLIPSSGGAPRRLTYTSTNRRDDLGDRMGPNNIVMGWTPDGRVVFRNRIDDGFLGQLYTVDTAGHLPVPIPLPEGGFCSFSPDGKRLAYNRVFREFRTWKRYTGGMADDVWVHDFESRKTTRLTDSRYQDIIPMWVGEQIVFLSERTGTGNLFSVPVGGGAARALTTFTDYDVKFPSSFGNHVVYENGGYIYHYDAGTGQNRRVEITLNAEAALSRSEYKGVQDYLYTVGLSPTGDSIVIEARGEVFIVYPELGISRNITNSGGAFDRYCDWSPDGRTIAYVSDASGEDQLYLYDVKGKQTRMVAEPGLGYVYSLDWSPDSRSLALTDARNNLWLVDVGAGRFRLALHDSLSMISGVTFSPDSRWVAYSVSGVNNYAQVWMLNVSTLERTAVTDEMFNSYSPFFSVDGKYLFFNSDRTFRPTYGWLEWNHIFDEMTGLYFVLLDGKALSPNAAFTREAVAAADAGNAKKGKKGKKEEKGDDSSGKKGTVVIPNPSTLPLLVERVNTPTGYHRVTWCSDDKVYYNRGGNAYVFDLHEGKETLLLENATLYPNRDGKKAMAFASGNKVYVLSSLPVGKTSLGDPVDFSGVRVKVDYPSEWKQIYDQAWRLYRDRFYVENMHGVDWQAMHAKHGALLPWVTTRQDLNYLIGELIGELNVGHAYVNPGEYRKAERIPMGLLGAEFSRSEDGKAFRIDRILRGNGWDRGLQSPLATPGLGVKEGDYILAVDGVSVSQVNNIYELLVGKAGKAVELVVNGSASENGAQRVVVKPIDNEAPLYHYEWVERNRRFVDSVSGGKVGYIYVPDMGPDGLIEFARYYYPQLEKEGLIIDDRANGGGNVSPMLIERLARKVYRLDMYRTSKRIGRTPDATHVGPKVCLINKYSASDGDLFPWSFRAMGLGKLIGTRTWGGIVGITGSARFMDGTDLRVPFFTNFDVKTGQWIIENEGVSPDIEVDNDPAREWEGYDEQLARAVEEVMRQLPAREKLPSTPPAPRVWNKESVRE